MSLSHDARYLVCATPRTFVVLKSVGGEYNLAGPGMMMQDDGDVITAILCLPLFVPSNLKSKPGSVSISVIVGFQSGCFKIYDENGTLLMSHLLNASPVISIKLRTVKSLTALTSNEPDADEVLIVYGDKKAVSIDGPSLWMAVKVVAGHKEIGELMSIEQPALTYSKWQFQRQREIRDLVSCGPSSSTVIAPPAFNPVTGEFASTRQSARYIGVGRPMITFYGTSEASRSYSLKNVANKVTHAVSSVFSLAKSYWTPAVTSLTGAVYPPSLSASSTPPEPAQQQQPDNVAPAVSVPAICTLSDPSRQITSITLSPSCPKTGRCGALAALTDTLGRVMLVDVEEGEIIRMFKGVRDAQCAWLQVLDKHHDPDNDPHHTNTIPQPKLLLAIYTARGVLEIYPVRHGPRVAGFQVGTDMRLVQTAMGVLGGAYGGEASPATSQLASCLLIGPNGEIKTVAVDKCT
ncbi:Rab3 GTPase-activating protein regulatory subunit N-terminus-domain-containing protein [Powellomyces hirtus]|nr:Rab3 GTPase-activating protein regulatory subunit N-terminus-domain-containing protein [Powellomyces hirtus]